MSNRLRAGSRISLSRDSVRALYVGGAYEYEFDGGSMQPSIPTPSIAPTPSGGTGIGEFVMSYKPSANSQTSINIGVQGFGGKRQGVAGNLFVRF